MNLGNWLYRQAMANPRRPALFLGKDMIEDYGGFHDRAARLAQWFLDQGVSPGDRVAIFMKNCPDYLIVQYAAWYAGAVVVPINAKLHGREAAFIIRDAGASLTMTDWDLGDVLAGAEIPGRIVSVGGAEYGRGLQARPLATPVARRADDLAWLFYTSGTTGRPKGVMISNRMLIAMSLAYVTDVDAVTREDSVIYAAPMSHGAGLYNMIHVLMGARHVCPLSAGFDAAEIFDLAGHFERAQMFAAPTMVKRMTDTARETGATGRGLRTVVYAGGPMYNADIIAAVRQFGPVFVQVYGQGECPMGITALSRQDVTDRSSANWQQRLASVGRAQAPVEVQIGDSRGRPLPPGEHGEIMVRGDVVMPGYWRNPEATRKTLVDGWLMTGDMGFIDAQGYVTLQDRSKDLIISGGSNVYPREVEEILLTHEQVEEVSVVGQADPEWGEIVVAFVVGKACWADLDRLCTENIARFKRPRRYVRLRELPKNNYGKILKTDLRARLKHEADAD
ncbi:AMP-binding protein [Rhodobacteraceae bacterium F11138]|nr:AMP-binding protein [Rhodobacteraceae bacterium F11138]